MSLTLDHGTEGASSFLTREGYYVGLRLAQDTLTTLLAHARTSTCYGEGDLGMPYRVEERDAAEQRYQCRFSRGSYLDQHERWDVFRALREDGDLLALATHYLECTPIYQRSEISWTYPHRSGAPERISGVNRVPRAAHTLRSLTFTFYLTDVVTADGPHTYIKSNPPPYALGAELRARSFQGTGAAHVRPRADQIVSIYGPRGIGFAGDPCLLTRSASPTLREHLSLQIELVGRGQALH